MPRPPSTGSTAPVMYAASGPARKATAAATSSADAIRPERDPGQDGLLAVLAQAAVMSVSTKPGATTLTVILREAEFAGQ